MSLFAILTPMRRVRFITRPEISGDWRFLNNGLLAHHFEFRKRIVRQTVAIRLDSAEVAKSLMPKKFEILSANNMKADWLKAGTRLICHYLDRLQLCPARRRAWPQHELDDDGHSSYWEGSRGCHSV
jgi:hypothetical protein